MALKIKIISTLMLIALSGCFFSAKEIILDPDKGSLHSEEVTKWPTGDADPQEGDAQGDVAFPNRKPLITGSRS